MPELGLCWISPRIPPTSISNRKRRRQALRNRQVRLNLDRLGTMGSIPSCLHGQAASRKYLLHLEGAGSSWLEEVTFRSSQGEPADAIG